jgi:hypothetical protein
MIDILIITLKAHTNIVKTLQIPFVVHSRTFSIIHIIKFKIQNVGFFLEVERLFYVPKDFMYVDV